ncbi:DUF1178 family protein [Roseibium polysiphoniae]|uniref:DUF1178 family protein n=1 Tax=Roseibium polysiphoniae TaxID=2571221 RepID=A0A944CFX2_9HYPH|nr:DUF1178 family protein [Roseibium polysiphoniae]
MIRYALSCDADHAFDGWFRNSDDFDKQCERELVSCPFCGSAHVQKTLMAPAVSTARSKEGRLQGESIQAVPQPEPAQDATPGGETAMAGSPPAQQPALMPVDAKHRELIEGLRALRRKVVESSDYVGKEFAEEARKIHYGETEERNIYGETSKEDAEALLDEGIAVVPLPALPDEQN